MGSVEEIQNYDYTRVNLRGRLFPAMRVIIYNMGPSNSFSVWTCFPFEIAFERRVKEYLDAVSKNL